MEAFLVGSFRFLKGTLLIALKMTRMVKRVLHTDQEELAMVHHSCESSFGCHRLAHENISGEMNFI